MGRGGLQQGVQLPAVRDEVLLGAGDELGEARDFPGFLGNEGLVPDPSDEAFLQIGMGLREDGQCQGKHAAVEGTGWRRQLLLGEQDVEAEGAGFGLVIHQTTEQTVSPLQPAERFPVPLALESAVGQGRGLDRDQ
jgi:hypothetical protein